MLASESEGDSQGLTDVEKVEAQAEELNRLVNFYRAEARRCRKARAYFAGCVMLGAALEGGLLGMADCYPDEVRACPKAPRRRGKPKPLTDWTLHELLKVAKAKELGWLPAKLGPDDEWDSDKAHIGDWAEVVRETRNLIHPGNYATNYTGMRIRAKDFNTALEVLEVAFDWLYSKLCESLKAELDRVEREEKPGEG